MLFEVHLMHLKDRYKKVEDIQTSTKLIKN